MLVVSYSWPGDHLHTPLSRGETIRLSGLTSPSYVNDNFISGQRRTVIHGAENIL